MYPTYSQIHADRVTLNVQILAGQRARRVYNRIGADICVERAAMKDCTLYLLGIGFTVLNRRAGGGVDAQSDGVSAANTYSPTTTPPDYSDCAGYLPHVKDGYCDNANNNADCGYDGGDCCECTCVDGPSQSCGELGVGYDCIDPDVPEGCGITPSPAASFGYPDCTGYIYNLQNGYCNDDLNNAECGYDGGDCCR